MSLFLAIVAIVLLVSITKLVRFLSAGGTLTQPARNATLMYRQIQIVYNRMPDRKARFMALFLNSAGARNEISEGLLRRLVSDFDGKQWSDLCETYTWLWAELVGHVDVDHIPSDIHFSRSEKIREQIRFAEFAVDHGDRRFENQLRAMPQSMAMIISAKADGIFS